MKDKRVKFLAIEFLSTEKSRELFSLKNKVKEFELHDIKVQHYSDLYINFANFTKEIY